MANDYYPTPEAITKALLDRVAIRGVVFEPCAGTRGMSDVLARHLRDMRSGELYDSDLTWAGADPRDATAPDFWWWWFVNVMHNELDWTITNPPFSAAEKILPLAWEHSQQGVALLLRLSYLEPTAGRAQWLQQHADHLRLVIPVSPPPRLRRGRGSHSVTCAWFVWRKTWSWSELGIACPFQFVAGWR